MIPIRQLLLALSTLLLSWATAQENRIELTGTVVEKDSEVPVVFATVAIVDRETGRPLTGTTTDDSGAFSLELRYENYYIEISLLGYRSVRLERPYGEGRVIDLGIIELEADAEELEAVIVEAEASQTEFKLDKRVFNVGKDLSSTGANALEVLNNVPSVNVNIEGQISLRGSTGVQVLINGKPSILASEEGNALGSITADMIERIEVITNPSAKFDAEGTSGILNIVIKKDERRGFNGSVSVNTGAPENNSIGLSLNYRAEKFNLFSQIGTGYRELPNDRESENTDLNTGNQILSAGEEFRNENYYNFVLGSDYYFSESSVLTLSGNFALELEDQPSRTNFAAVDSNGLTTSQWERTEVTDADNPKFQFDLQYKKSFAGNEDHNLLFSAQGNFFAKDQSSDFEDVTLEGEDRDNSQKTRTDFGEARYTVKLDYAVPLTERIGMETGSQYVTQDVSNEFEVQDLIEGEFVSDPGLTNTFEFDQDVFALYGSLAYEGEKWGLKGGLRLENTDLNTILVTTGETNDQNYTSYFPSAFSSFKFSEKFSMQAGYSRRVYRPRLWDLNPFFNIRNNFNIRQGNPNLQPEFTDSYEFTTIVFVGKTALNLGLYHRYTSEVIERIAFFDNNVTTTRPENIGTNRTTGIEFNTKYSPARWLTFNLDFNYGWFDRQGTFEAQVFDFQADQWSTKLLTKLKLPWDIEIEATGNYRSDFQTVQGVQQEIAFVDMGIRKKMLKGKAVLNLSVRDAFASRVEESFVFQDDFQARDQRFRGRFLSFGFSYGFGRGEAMEFSGKR